LLNSKSLIESPSHLETVRESTTTLDYYDSGYIYVERVPLVKVSLTNHYGIELNDPSDAFFLNKNKIVIIVSDFFTILLKSNFL